MKQMILVLGIAKGIISGSWHEKAPPGSEKEARRVKTRTAIMEFVRTTGCISCQISEAALAVKLAIPVREDTGLRRDPRFIGDV